MAYIRNGVGIIGVNALHHPNRQRFTAAHELAHHELHPDEIRNEVHVDEVFRVLRRDDVAAQGVDWREIEANAFAAELLMPRSLLQELIDPEGLDLDDEDKLVALAQAQGRRRCRQPGSEPRSRQRLGCACGAEPPPGLFRR